MPGKRRQRRSVRSKRETQDTRAAARAGIRIQWPVLLIGVALLGGIALAWTYWRAELFHARYDADYVGSPACADCHSIVHGQWRDSPHANMIRPPGPDSVIGDFANAEFHLPGDSPDPLAGEPVARAYTRDGDYYMALLHPEEDRFVEFPIELVVGYQYRQEYLTREPGGVLRRLPLQWSTATGSYFPYWNVQENTPQTLPDLWRQMTSLNSAWNLFCARCHTTNLEIEARDAWHTVARTNWTENGIACEACHGPGSLHVEYMRSSAVNRIAMWVQNHIQGRPVAYIASAAKLDKGQALSVCGRCHGADIFTSNQDIYRQFEPGYSRSGRINDLSEYFTQVPLTPGRMAPTVEVWLSGRPRGIGMLFRSFIESDCHRQSEVRCTDCHDPHANKRPATAGILHASAASDAYCTACHQDLARAVRAHTRHEPGEPGSFCYDCHMPWHITKLNRGVWERTRTHDMSSVPNPQDSVRFGLENAPNACSDCHSEQGPAWAVETMERWWPGSTTVRPVPEPHPAEVHAVTQ